MNDRQPSNNVVQAQRDHFFNEAGLLHHALAKIEGILWEQAKYRDCDPAMKEAWQTANKALHEATKRATIKVAE